jgi:hypothetical protein
MDGVYEARRTAVGMAAQVAQGNADEFDLLLRGYLDDAFMRRCALSALVALATSAVSLAVFASGNDTEYFTRLAERMVVHGE